ncbi:MAG: zinc ribbon domain-containing protein [Actinomycetota bacterium]
MIKCPVCGRESPEGSKFCNICGQSLAGLQPSEPAPEESRAEVPEEQDGTEEVAAAPAKASSAIPALLGFGLIALVAIGVVVYSQLQPTTCADQFESDRFGYCVTVPQGWDAGEASVGQTPVDSFAVKEGAATVVVIAIDLAEQTSLTQFAEDARQNDEAQGLQPSGMKPLQLDGEPAQAWGITTTSPNGQEYKLVQVVTVRNDVGWTISLSDSAEAFDSHERSFREMLASWQFQ